MEASLAIRPERREVVRAAVDEDAGAVVRGHHPGHQTGGGAPHLEPPVVEAGPVGVVSGVDHADLVVDGGVDAAGDS